MKKKGESQRMGIWKRTTKGNDRDQEIGMNRNTEIEGERKKNKIDSEKQTKTVDRGERE